MENKELESCFIMKFKILFFKISVPEDLVENNFKGNAKVLLR
jgi:hypothetical protein